MKVSQPPSLSQYMNYREYLEHYFRFRVQTCRSFSRPYCYSDFSAAADIKSPNYLKLIIEGKRNLSKNMCHRFSKALKHNRSQAQEFFLLVSYGQEKDILLRNQCLKKLSEYRLKKDSSQKGQNPKSLNSGMHWLPWVLYAMADQEGVEFDPSKLRSLLSVDVSDRHIQRALEDLKSSRELKMDETRGRIEKGASLIADSHKVSKELVQKIQSEFIYLSQEALHKYGPRDREVSGVTLALTEKEYEWVRFELRKLRKYIQKKILTQRVHTKGDRVYQINIQLFPLTESTKVNSAKMDSVKSTGAMGMKNKFL